MTDEESKKDAMTFSYGFEKGQIVTSLLSSLGYGDGMKVFLKAVSSIHRKEENMTTRALVGGFEDRFCVTRRDGKPIRPSARYIVLDYSGADPHAVAALRAYAFSIRVDNPDMAFDVLDALASPEKWPAQHD
jgi:hypothetical protein